MTQVTRPHSRGIAAAGKIHLNQDVTALQGFFRAGSCCTDRRSASENRNAVQAQSDPFRIEWYATVADGGEDPAPVQFLAIESRLNERRMGDCFGDLAR